LSIFLESPVFALQQAVVAWYGGSGSIRPYVSFAFAVGLLMMVIEAVVVFSPAGPFLFRTLMGAPEHLIEPSMHALQVSIVFPPLVATRLGFQGILIGRRRTAPIAWGTSLRLVTLAVLVLVVCPRLPLEAPSAAMAALALAVVVELVYVAIAANRAPEREGVPSPAQEAGRRLSGKVRFLLPLAGTMALGTLTNPVINAFIARTDEPETALAGYAVIASLVWFLASPALRYSAVTIALGNTAANLNKLRRFLLRFVGGVSIGVFLITLTPIAVILLEDLIGLGPELAARVRVPLIFLSIQPLIAGFVAYNQGVLTRRARTGAVGVGSVSRVLAIMLLGVIGLSLEMRGELLGGVLLGASFAAEYLALVALSARWESA